MSIQTFQRVLVELTLSPRKARALREGDASMFAGLDLTGLERERLFDIVRQPGISVHCSLSRGNRFEVIFGAFPMTCVLLEPVLRELLDEFCEACQPTNYQLAGEDAAFAAMLRGKIAAGALSIEYLREIFDYELACAELTQALQNQMDPDAGVEAVVEFQHSPDELLPSLSRLKAPPAGLPQGSCRVRVKLQNNQFRVETLDPYS